MRPAGVKSAEVSGGRVQQGGVARSPPHAKAVVRGRLTKQVQRHWLDEDICENYSLAYPLLHKPLHSKLNG